MKVDQYKKMSPEQRESFKDSLYRDAYKSGGFERVDSVRKKMNKLDEYVVEEEKKEYQQKMTPVDTSLLPTKEHYDTVSSIQRISGIVDDFTNAMEKSDPANTQQYQLSEEEQSKLLQEEGGVKNVTPVVSEIVGFTDKDYAEKGSIKESFDAGGYDSTSAKLLHVDNPYKGYELPEFKWNELSAENANRFLKNFAYVMGKTVADIPFFTATAGLGTWISGGSRIAGMGTAIGAQRGVEEYFRPGSTGRDVAKEVGFGFGSGVLGGVSGKIAGPVFRYLTGKGFGKIAGPVFGNRVGQVVGLIAEDAAINEVLLQAEAAREGRSVTGEERLLGMGQSSAMMGTTRIVGKMYDKLKRDANVPIFDETKIDKLRAEHIPEVDQKINIIRPVVEKYFMKGRNVEDSYRKTVSGILETIDTYEKGLVRENIIPSDVLKRFCQDAYVHVEDMHRADNLDMSINAQYVDVARKSKRVKESYSIEDLKSAIKKTEIVDGQIKELAKKSDGYDPMEKLGLDNRDRFTEVNEKMKVLAKRKGSTLQYLKRYGDADSMARMKAMKEIEIYDLYKNFNKDEVSAIVDVYTLPESYYNMVAKMANMWGGNMGRMRKSLAKWAGGKDILFENWVGKDFTEVFFPAVNQAEKIKHKLIADFQKVLKDQFKTFDKAGGNSFDVMLHMLSLQKNKKGDNVGTNLIKKLKQNEIIPDDYVVKSFDLLSEAEKNMVGFANKYFEHMWTMFNKTRRILGLNQIEGLGEGYIPMVSDYETMYRNGTDFMTEKNVTLPHLTENRLKDIKPMGLTRYIKKRGKGSEYLDLDLYNVMDVYAQHMYQKIALAPVSAQICKYADRLEKYQPEASAFITRTSKYWLGDYIDSTPKIIRRFLDSVNKSVAFSYLCGNIGTIMTQMTAIDMPIAHFGFENVNKSIGYIVEHGFDEIRRLSPAFESRAGDLSLSHMVESMRKTKMDKIAETGMFPIKALDIVAAGITWKTAFEHYQKTMPRQDAARAADSYINKTQATASRFYNNEMYTYTIGKTLGVLQTFVFKRFHYTMAELFGTQSAYEFVRTFKNKDDAYAYVANRKGHEVSKMSCGTYAVYDKVKAGNYMKKIVDFGKLMFVHQAMNLGFSSIQAVTGLPVAAPFADPLNAWWMSKYGTTFLEDMFGTQARKGSKLPEEERNWRAGAQVMFGSNQFIPTLGSGLQYGEVGGAVLSNTARTIGHFKKAIERRDGREFARGLLRLSAFRSNPFFATLNKLDRTFQEHEKREESFIRQRNRNKKSGKNKYGNSYNRAYKNSYKNKY